MARKHAQDHQRYQPVDEAFIRSVPLAVGTTRPISDEQASERTVEAKPPVAVRSPKSVTPPVADDFDETREEEEEKGPQSATVAPERLDKPLKFRLPRSERVDVMRIVSRLADQLQTSVEWSHVGRALVVLLRHAESEIVKHARRNGPLTRPPNDQAIAMAEFEQRIAQILLRALREVAPLR
jgi:hypothetical protein